MTAGALGIHALALGEFATNCYVLTAGAPGGGKTCWVIDPGMTPAPLLDYLAACGLSPTRILITHGHFDHIAGIAALKQAYPAVIITAPAGEAHVLPDPVLNGSLFFGLHVAAPPADETIKPGTRLEMPIAPPELPGAMTASATGATAEAASAAHTAPADQTRANSANSLTFIVIDVSGHSPGGVAFYCPQADAVFTGDALFADSIGRSDLPGSDGNLLVQNIRRHLLTLPDATGVYPGHGPATTIAQEKRHNPFLTE
jgi:glyoxylase-like metal-dependent hydrolase (beta-lactamase superfamily II)